MYRRLSRDVTAAELLVMTESGMTNQDIADSLDVSYQTVFRMIGKQPKELHGTGKPRPKKGLGKFDYGEVEKKVENKVEYEPCLSVENKTLDLAGLVATYNISIKEKSVVVSLPDDEHEGNNVSFKIDFDSIDIFNKEISAINRKISDLSVGIEMW